VNGKKPGPRCKNAKLGVEIYETDRFFTVTGQRIDELPSTINDRQAELEALYSEVFPPLAPSSSNGHTAKPVVVLSMDDQELITRMLRKNGRVQALWDGDTSGHANDDSAADLALCNELAFYTNRDAGRIDRLFRQSGLYRPKWERQDYRDRTIDKAIAGTATTYDPNYRSNGEDETDEPPNALAVEPVRNLALGWITDYTNLMFDLTASPKEFHQLAGLITVAAAIQRKARLRLSFGDVYPNLYGCIVAMSTVYGKTTAIYKPRSILSAAMLDNLLIPSHGSSEGLIQQLSESPNALMIRDEIGTLFSSDKVKYLKDYKQDLTALYDCTPYNRRLRNEGISVPRPYLNILGATTPERFYGGINQNDWSDGLLPRWLFVVPEGRPNFDAMPATLTEEHTNKINRLALKLMEIDRYPEKDFVLTGNALSIWSDWRKAGLMAAYEAQDNTAMAIIGRYATYALKFAIILAAINDSWGIISPEIMRTAMYLADNYKHTVNRIITEADRHRVTGAKMQKVFGVVKAKNTDGQGVTLRIVQQFANLSRQEAQQCMEQLVEYGAVITNEIGKSTRYVNAVTELQLKKWSNE
jgi:predicted transcriptional regulator